MQECGLPGTSGLCRGEEVGFWREMGESPCRWRRTAGVEAVSDQTKGNDTKNSKTPKI